MYVNERLSDMFKYKLDTVLHCSIRSIHFLSLQQNQFSDIFHTNID